jgi:hypothetical protein
MTINVAFALYNLCLLTFTFIEEAEASDFQDLGKLLFGGVIAAIVVAVGFSFIKIKLRDKNPPSNFISINSFAQGPEPVKPEAPE